MFNDTHGYMAASKLFRGPVYFDSWQTFGLIAMLVWKDLVKTVYFIYIFIWSFLSKGHHRACGSISLIKGPKNVVVDTGNPWDRDHILDGMYMCVCLKKKMLQIIESGNSELRFADHLSTNTGSFMYKKNHFSVFKAWRKMGCLQKRSTTVCALMATRITLGTWVCLTRPFTSCPMMCVRVTNITCMTSKRWVFFLLCLIL